MNIFCHREEIQVLNSKPDKVRKNAPIADFGHHHHLDEMGFGALRSYSSKGHPILFKNQRGVDSDIYLWFWTEPKWLFVRF